MSGKTQTSLDKYFRKTTRLTPHSAKGLSTQKTARKLFDEETIQQRNFVDDITSQKVPEAYIPSASSVLDENERLTTKPDKEIELQREPEFDDVKSVCSSEGNERLTVTPDAVPDERKEEQETLTPPAVLKSDEQIPILEIKETESEEKHEIYDRCSSNEQEEIKVQIPEPKEKPAELQDKPTISIPSTSANDDTTVHKEREIPSTPRTRRTREDVPSTPHRSTPEQYELRKQHRLGEFKKIPKLNRTRRFLKRPIEPPADSYGSPKLKKFNTVNLEITSPVKRGTLKPRRLFETTPSKSTSSESPYVSPRKLLEEALPRSPVKPVFDYFNRPLVLPRKFLDLKEMFHWMDMICNLRAQKRELITFNSIKGDVQKALLKNFTEEHVAKIKAVYPDAFTLSRELVKTRSSRNKTYELVITLPKERNPVEREKTLHNLLLEKAKCHHQEFLKTLEIPMYIPLARVTQWHREFDVNSVPDIVPVPLPLPPVQKNSPVSAREILDKTYKLISSNKRMEHVVSGMIDTRKEETKKPPEPTSPSTPTRSAFLERELRGVPQSLLAKIRAKQAAKIAEEITRSPAQMDEARKLSRLPELAKLLRIVFVREKEKAGILEEDLVIEKVQQCYKEKMTSQSLIEHFELISKQVPGWLTRYTVQKKQYIRLSINSDMERITSKLQNIAKRA